MKLDRERKFRYTFEEIEMIEDALNMNWDDVITKLFKAKARMKEIFTVVWAGLYGDDNTLTVEAAKKLVYEHSTLEEVMFEVGKAIGDAMKHIKAENNSQKN